MAVFVTRQTLRERTVEALALAGVADGHVAPSRTQPVRPGQARVLVYTPRESGVNPSKDGPPKFDTMIELVIDAFCEEDDEATLDDTQDALADAILAATLENPAWLAGIESVATLDVFKNPPGPDGKDVAGGVRVQMQVSVGEVIYTPEITTLFTGLDGKMIDGDARSWGVDINGDGKTDIAIQFNPPQE